MRSCRPYCLISDEGGDNVEGTGNHFLKVCNQEGDVENLLFCLDSGSYSPAQDRGVDGYLWFDHSLVRRKQLWRPALQRRQAHLS